MCNPDLFEWYRKKRYKKFNPKEYNKQYRKKNRERLKENYRIWHENNRDKLNTNQRRYHQTIVGRANSLVNSAKLRARNKGESFNLCSEDIISILERGICERTGIKFNMTMGIRLLHGKGMHPHSPSIDKIDPFGIYEPKNIQLVCAWYNMAKAQLTDAEMLELCKTVVKFNEPIQLD